MIIENEYLKLETVNRGGEMSSLIYKPLNKEVLYDGKGPYWSGKNPTLFPMIRSTESKDYVFEGKTYNMKNHGLIRYADLTLVSSDEKSITYSYCSDENTLKQYPFEFEYYITYRLNGKCVEISYLIKNRNNRTMPFSFGLHPAFLVDSFDDLTVSFEKEEKAYLIHEEETGYITKDVILKEYKDFKEDLLREGTVAFKNIKSDYVDLKANEYTVRVHKKGYPYLCLWSQNLDTNYICIESWKNFNNISKAINPFSDEYELEHVEANGEYTAEYKIEIC